MSWTEEREAELRRLYGLGLSADAIAAELGITRNAAIGKIDRLGLSSGKPRSEKPEGARRVRSTRFVDHGNYFKKYGGEPASLPAMPGGSNIPIAQRCTLPELNNSMCKWPFGEPSSPDFFFCGADAIPNYPYCGAHCRLAYRGYWN
jgi:GcrA cell cycle regulator